MAVKLDYLDNPRQTVQDMYNKEGVFKDGTYLPELDKSSAAYIQAQQFLSIIPSTINKIIGVRYKGLFKQPITRNVVANPEIYNDLLDALNQSVDATGMSRDEFVAEAALNASMLDFQFTVFDNFTPEEIAQYPTMEAKIESRVFPFFKNIPATQVNWDYYETDNYGRVSKFGYDYSVLFEGETVTRTKVMTAEKYFVYEDDKLISEVDHLLGEIPCFVLKNNKNIKNASLQITNPSLWNVVKVVLNVATLKAFSDASELINCVKIWAYPATKTQMQQLADKQPPAIINNENIFLYDGEFANKPDVISPGAGNTEIILQTEQWKLESLFIDEGMNYTSGANASGKAKQIDREQINTALGFLCNSLISLDTWMDEIFAKSMDFTIESASYVYPKLFGIDAVKEQLDELQYILDIGADRYPELAKRVLKEAYSLKFNSAEDMETLETALEEGEMPIDNLETIRIMATDKQLYNRYINLMKEAGVVIKSDTNSFVNGFIRYVNDNPNRKLAVLFDEYYTQVNFGDEMVAIGQATDIKQISIPYQIQISRLELVIENSNDKIMREIFGKTNGNDLSRNIYRTTKDTKNIIYKELARIDKEVVGFRNSVKNLQSAIGGDIDQQKQVAKYIKDLENSAKRMLKDSSDDTLKEFRKNQRYAQKQINKLTNKRQLGRKQQAALNQIVRGAEKKIPELIEKGIARAIKAKNESQMQRLVVTENTRVFQQGVYNERVDTGVVHAVKFVKNPRHKIYDICDIIEGTDQYGLGPAIFPIRNQLSSPIHPNWQGYWRAIPSYKIDKETANSRGKYNTRNITKNAEKEGLSPSAVKAIKDHKQQSYADININKLKAM